MSGIIDVHHHYICEHGYLDGLLREMDRLGIEKAGLMAMGPPRRQGDPSELWPTRHVVVG